MRNGRYSKKKKRGFAVVQVLLLILIAFVLGLSVYSFNAKQLLGNPLPMPFGYGTAVVLSGSMEPTLKIDDLVIVKETDDYQVGDVIIFQSGTKLVVHRIKEINGNNLITQGDANNTQDESITFDVVKGRMAFRIPFIGFAVRMLKTTAGSVCVMAAAAALFLLSWKKEKEEDQARLNQMKSEIEELKKEIDNQ